MLGLYKTDKELFLFEYISYRRLDWKNFLKKKDKIVPQIVFDRKGVLLLYNLKSCYIEQNQIYYKGRELQLLYLAK